MVFVKFVHETLMDDRKGFSFLFVFPSLRDTIFHRIHNKVWKINKIMVPKMVEKGEMVVISYLELIFKGNIPHNAIKNHIKKLEKILMRKLTMHVN